MVDMGKRDEGNGSRVRLGELNQEVHGSSRAPNHG